MEIEVKESKEPLINNTEALFLLAKYTINLSIAPTQMIFKCTMRLIQALTLKFREIVLGKERDLAYLQSKQDLRRETYSSSKKVQSLKKYRSNSVQNQYFNLLMVLKYKINPLPLLLGETLIDSYS